MKKSFFNPAFAGTSLVLLLILFIRVTRGLDLTDEMQYYGEIKGLVETGRLFSNDLYIQQTVYLLLYPAFYLHHLFFGSEGLVLFGRLLLAVLSLAVFVYAYRKLLGFGFTAGVASVTALALSFASPYHGIFAPSYNTIAQLLWVVFMLRFFEWGRREVLTFSVIPVITALVHPTSGAMMFLLAGGRMLSERRYAETLELLLKSAAGGVAVMLAAFSFASPQEYRAALEFSSGYGVGETFFATRSQPAALITIIALFGICILFGQRIKANYRALVGLVASAMLILFLWGYAGGAFSVRVVYVLSLMSILAYLWALLNIPREDRRAKRRLDWLAAALLAYATTLGVTSGNGLMQATGAFMVGLPVLLGLALSTDPNREKLDQPRTAIAIVSMIVALFSVLWISYPYREDYWWRNDTRIDSIPEFRHINTSEARAGFINGMQNTLGAAVQGKHTLIISSYPALYFALGASPETCMLFMHSLPRGKAEDSLRNCMAQRRPEAVIDVFEPGGTIPEHAYIRTAMQEYYSQRGFRCKDSTVEFAAVSRYNPARLNNRVCSRASGQS